MKALKIICGALIFLTLPATAQQTITLEKSQQLARENYPLSKRNQLITQSKNYTLENISRGWLPQVNITAQATYQNAVTELPLKLPNVNLEPVSKDQYKILADIQQSIFDGGMISNQKKIAEINSQTELQKNEIELRALEERINQLYFGVLLTQEQQQQINLTKNDLQNALEKAEIQLKYGNVFRSNVDVLKAQILNIEQKDIELQAARQTFLQMLSAFLQIQLTEETLIEKPPMLAISKANHRAELKLFYLQQQAIEAQKSLLNSKNSPKLGAFLQGGYGKPGFNMLKNEFDIFYIAGLRLQIPLTGFYTRKNDFSLLELQQEDISIRKENFLFNQNFSQTQAENDLEKLHKLILKDEELIVLRERIKKASLAQLENGVITTNDYVREVNAEEQARLQKMLHEIQFLLTQYNQKAQLGQ